MPTSEGSESPTASAAVCLARTLNTNCTGMVVTLVDDKKINALMTDQVHSGDGGPLPNGDKQVVAATEDAEEEEEDDDNDVAMVEDASAAGGSGEGAGAGAASKKKKKKKKKKKSTVTAASTGEGEDGDGSPSITSPGVTNGKASAAATADDDDGNDAAADEESGEATAEGGAAKKKKKRKKKKAGGGSMPGGGGSACPGGTGSKIAPARGVTGFTDSYVRCVQCVGENVFSSDRVLLFHANCFYR